MAREFKFKNRDKVRDTLTGFEGTIDCCTRWANGCIRYGVVAFELKDAKRVFENFDEEDLELIERAPKEKAEPSGGAREAAERAADPVR